MAVGVVNKNEFLEEMGVFLSLLGKIETELNNLSIYYTVPHEAQNKITALQNEALFSCKNAMCALGLDDIANIFFKVTNNIDGIDEKKHIKENNSLKSLNTQIIRYMNANKNVFTTEQQIIITAGIDAINTLSHDTEKNLYPGKPNTFLKTTMYATTGTLITGAAFTFLGGMVGAVLGMIIGLGLFSINLGIFSVGTIGTATSIGLKMGAPLGCLVSLKAGWQVGSGHVNEVAKARYKLLKTIDDTREEFKNSYKKELNELEPVDKDSVEQKIKIRSSSRPRYI